MIEADKTTSLPPEPELQPELRNLRGVGSLVDILGLEEARIYEEKRRATELLLRRQAVKYLGSRATGPLDHTSFTRFK